MTNISEKEFGKLQSDVEYLKEESRRHTTILERMDTKLDGLVTRREFIERTKSSDKRFDDLEKEISNISSRVNNLEIRNTKKDASLSGKLSVNIERFIVTALSAGIVTLIVNALLYSNGIVDTKKVNSVERGK